MDKLPALTDKSLSSPSQIEWLYKGKFNKYLIIIVPVTDEQNIRWTQEFEQFCFLLMKINIKRFFVIRSQEHKHPQTYFLFF